MTVSESREDRLLVEYQAAQESYLHHDALPWQIGGLLIAGVFVFWGFLLDKLLDPNIITAIPNAVAATSNIVAVASIIVTLLMSAWMLYAHQVRQIYFYKLDRIHEIERELGMEQHRRFVATENTAKHYKYSGPSGFVLNLVIYTVVSLGGLVLGWAQVGWNSWFILSIALFAGVLIWIFVNDRNMKSMLTKKSS